MVGEEEGSHGVEEVFVFVEILLLLNLGQLKLVSYLLVAERMAGSNVFNELLEHGVGVVADHVLVHASLLALVSLLFIGFRHAEVMVVSHLAAFLRAKVNYFYDFSFF